MSFSPFRLRNIVRKEFRQLLRDPRSRPILFVSPLIQLVLFGYAVSTDVRHVPTFVVDQDRTPESRALVESFTASGYFDVAARSDRPADMVRALDRGDVTAGLQIPPGFSADLAAGRGHVQLLLDGSDSNEATVAQGYAAAILGSFGVETAVEGSSTAGPGASLAARTGPVDLRARAWYNPQLESRVYNVPAVIGILLLIICLILTAMGVVRERETGTLDQLLVSPITSSELILGKTIPVLTVGLVDLCLIGIVGTLWFAIPFRGSALALLVAALLFIVTGLAVGLLVSTISRTQQEAFMTLFLFILPSVILSGFFFPIRSMPKVFQWITVANPVRWFLEIVRGVFLKGATPFDLWLDYAILTVMAAGALSLAVGRFRREIR